MDIWVRYYFVFQLFTGGYCKYQGSLMENYENIPSKEVCQQACLLDTKCQYFIYNAREKNCEILDDDHRQCDTIRGPPSPNYEVCETAYFQSG